MVVEVDPGIERLREPLAGAAKGLGLDLAPAQAGSLLAYLGLLARWNATYNLTSVRDTAQMLTQHLADCLAVVEPLRRHLGPQASARVLDVGSGAGLPGLVLAVMLPALHITCVDTVGKKAAFIRQAAGELGLRQLHAVHGRVEQLKPAPVDVVVSRAFASLADFVRLTNRQLAASGVWLAMKGRRPDDEIAELPAGIEVFHVERLQVPGLDAERCLVWLRQADPLGQFPRE